MITKLQTQHQHSWETCNRAGVQWPCVVQIQLYSDHLIKTTNPMGQSVWENVTATMQIITFLKISVLRIKSKTITKTSLACMVTNNSIHPTKEKNKLSSFARNVFLIRLTSLTEQNTCHCIQSLSLLTGTEFGISV